LINIFHTSKRKEKKGEGGFLRHRRATSRKVQVVKTEIEERREKRVWM